MTSQVLRWDEGLQRFRVRKLANLRGVFRFSVQDFSLGFRVLVFWSRATGSMPVKQAASRQVNVLVHQQVQTMRPEPRV